MEHFLSILVVAVLVEAIWENIKMVWQNGKLNINMIGALVISVLVAVLTKINIFSALEISINVYIGSALTGIIISRGANFVHDIFTKVNQLKSNNAE